MKTPLFYKLASLLVMASSVLACSGKNQITGKFTSYDGHPLDLRGDGGQTLAVENGDLVSITLENRGLVLNSKISIHSKNGKIELPVTKEMYTTKKSFMIPKKTSGQSADIYGFATKDFLKSWEETGKHSCDAGGDCGSMQYMYDGKGNITGMYWVSATCWGTQDAIFNVNQFQLGYRLEFKQKGNIQAFLNYHSEKSVKQILSACAR